MQDGSENQRWTFVYMRNVDVSRLTPRALEEIWGALGISTSQVVASSSIGSFLAEFIVDRQYVGEFIERLVERVGNQPMPRALQISHDAEYSPLTPYSHILPRTCRMPSGAREALRRYAREALGRRWCALYHGATDESVREFIRASLEQHGVELTLAHQQQHGQAREPKSQQPQHYTARSGSDLVHQRAPNHSILSVDHLAELIPKPDSHRLIAYADGAFLPDRASAGIGVYFENANLAPIAQRLRGHQSNARAEIFALVTALDSLAQTVRNSAMAMEIWVCSDSRYAVDGINVNAEVWRQAQWRTAKGKPVANRTAFMQLIQSMERLDKCGHTVFVHHLPAHAGIRGNEIADMLAKAGALLDT